MKDWQELVILWLIYVVAAATVVGGKLGLFLFRLAADPPDDEKLARLWERRRRWLAYSELSALPAFATIAVALVKYRQLDPVLGVLISMFLGGVGFALLLDGAQWVFRKRLGLPEKQGPFGGNTSTETSP